jgi:hypothetical protein
MVPSRSENRVGHTERGSVHQAEIVIRQHPVQYDLGRQFAKASAELKAEGK